MPEKEKRGKAIDYDVNYFDAYMDLIETAYDMQIPEDDSDLSRNVWGYIDYTVDRKHHYNLKLIGVHNVNKTNTKFDLVDDESNLLIPRDTPVLDIHLSRTNLNLDPNEIITPQMITPSLKLIAAYIDGMHDANKPEYVIGITHSRLAQTTSRWGFSTVTYPFPKEIYELFDKAAEMRGLSQSEEDDIIRLRNEVLVFQQKQDFMKMYLEQPPVDPKP